MFQQHGSFPVAPHALEQLSEFNVSLSGEHVVVSHTVNKLLMTS